VAGVMMLPRGTGNYSTALQQVLKTLPPGVLVRSVQRTRQKISPTSGWDGQTLLLAEPSTEKSQ